MKEHRKRLVRGGGIRVIVVLLPLLLLVGCLPPPPPPEDQCTAVSVAEFAVSTSKINEGESINVTVRSSSPFSGTLQYSVSGTATAGDYSISMSGDSFQITITDDGELEDIETLVLRLEEGQCYIPGASTVHTVYVHDNDAIWNGAIEHDGLAAHFQMKIIQQGGEVTGALVTDGYGIIPLNGESTEWPATSMTLSDTSFEATIEGITIPATSTLADVDMVRELVFTANSVEPTVISGVVTEEVTCDGAPQFAYTMDGTFALLKQIPTMPEELINP